MDVLESLSRGHDEAWASTRTLAARLKLTVRAVHVRLSRLVMHGLVERVWDYSLKTRRRLVLLWRRTVSAVASVAATVPLPAAASLPLSLPEPVVVVAPVEMLTLCEPETALVPEPTAAPSATPDEVPVERIEAAAAAIAPADPKFASVAVAKAKRLGANWVLATLADLQRAAKKSPIRRPAALFHRILSDYLADGVEPPDPGIEERRKEAEREAILARMMIEWGP